MLPETARMNEYTTTSSNGPGFLWNGVWHSMTDQMYRGDGPDDDAPPTGVREPRRPRTPLAPAAAAVPLPEMEYA